MLIEEMLVTVTTIQNINAMIGLKEHERLLTALITHPYSNMVHTQTGTFSKLTHYVHAILIHSKSYFSHL